MKWKRKKAVENKTEFTEAKTEKYFTTKITLFLPLYQRRIQRGPTLPSAITNFL